MEKTESLEDVLQMAKEQTGTFEELARELGIVKTTITKWRNGTRWPTDQQCKQLAEKAGISTETVLMLCMLEKKKESPTLREWKKIALPYLIAVLIVSSTAVLPELALCKLRKSEQNPNKSKACSR